MKTKPTYEELAQRIRYLEAVQARQEHLLAGFIKNTVVGFYQSTPAGRFEWVNTAFAHILGYQTPEALVGEVCDIRERFLVHGQDKDRFMTLMKENGGVENFEYRIRQRTGGEIWVSETARAVFDENGEVLRFEGMVLDITRRRNSEAARDEAENFIRSLLNSLPIPVFYKDRDGRYRGFNTAFEAFYGKKSKSLLGKSVFDISPDSLARTYHAMDKALFDAGGTQRYEAQVKNARGELKDVIFDKSVYRDRGGAIAGLIGAVTDITARKQVEQALQESETRFRAVFEDANDGILAACQETKKFVLANNVICRMLGYDREELLGLSVYDIHPEQELPRVLSAFGRLVRREVKMVENIPVLRKDGSVFYADINASSIVAGGEILLVGIFRDITERRLMEQALRKSEERFRELAELLPGAVVETDPEANITYVNRMGMAMFGYTETDVAAGLNGLDLICPEQRDAAKARLMDRVSQQEVSPTEYRMLTKDNQELWVFFNASPILRKAEVTGFRVVLTDISERKAIEKERESLINELQAALAEIKTLRGIVPICAKCKKIRDDRGYWNTLETFIQEHSEASFSHGICPECSEKLYGKYDWYQDIKEKKKADQKDGSDKEG